MTLLRKHRWSKKDQDYVLFYWDSKSIREIAKELNRTPHAVHKKAVELGIRAKHREGMSLQAFSKMSGFAPSKIYATAKILNINLRRAFAHDGSGIPRCSKLSLSEDVQQRLLDYMLNKRAPANLKSKRGINGEWGTGQKPNACQSCTTTERPHRALGLCRSCWEKQNRAQKRTTQEGAAT